MASKKPTTAPTPVVEQGPQQSAILLVQVEALSADDTIRAELKKRGFAIITQALVHLTPANARHYVCHIHNPDSPQYQPVKSPEDASSSSSPRDKVASPRSPRPPTNSTTNAEDAARVEDAIEGLSSGPVLLLHVEKPNAIADLLDLVGPSSPDQWSSSPSSLRGRLATDAVRIGVRCSAHECSVAEELAFLLAHTQAPSAHHHQHHSQQRSADRSAAVDLAQLLAFLFPSHVQHPNSTGRLFVFGLYGPLSAEGSLRSGERGTHVVTDRELDTMASRMEREDILAVYAMGSLSQEDEEQVLRTVDGTLKHFPRYSQRDVEQLFLGLRRDASGRLSFHDMQAAIMRERCRRVLCMKERVHPQLAAPLLNRYRLSLRRLAQTRDEVAPASMFVKDLGFSGAENATLVARLLSNHAFEICQLDDANAPELTQNVRLLRAQVHDPAADPRPRWDPSTAARAPTVLG